MKILITGGCGFLGSNIASALLEQGYEVLIFDNLSRDGSIENLDWLRKQGKFTFRSSDIRNPVDVDEALRYFKPNTVVHLAGQVAMTTSISSPRKDFETNTLGTFNVLDGMRRLCVNSGILYSSTNKVYGDLEWIKYNEKQSRYEPDGFETGFDENLPLSFSSPYGCSKGAAEQYVLDSAKTFGIKASVFRHSSMYGGRQFATYDQGWVGWFSKCYANRNIDQFTINGSGKQVRDLLHAEDMKKLYIKAITQLDDISGEAFNIGGGVKNSLSLLELFKELEKISGRKLRIQKLSQRMSDQKYFVANISKVKKKLQWEPEVDYQQGLLQMYEWSKNIVS